MARTLVFTESMLLRLPAGTKERIRAVEPDMDVASFVRAAIDAEIERRSKARDKGAKKPGR